MIEKYKWKCRILLVKTTNYKNSDYLKTKKLYQKEIKKFHKRIVKLYTKSGADIFSIDLIGFDGKKKASYKSLNCKKIFKLIDKMQISENQKYKNIKPLNLSLFSDYNPKSTTKGLGFKDKEKALYTIRAVKKRDLKYQVNVISTMLGRAKKHPNRTKDMDKAIKILTLWMKDYKRKVKT